MEGLRLKPGVPDPWFVFRRAILLGEFGAGGGGRGVTRQNGAWFDGYRHKEARVVNLTAPQRATRSPHHILWLMVENSPLFSRSRGRWATAFMVSCVAIAGALTYLALRPDGQGSEKQSGGAAASTTKLDEVLSTVAVLKRDGAFEKAQVVLRQTIAEYPSEAQPYIEYAEVLIALGRPEEAYANYQRALKEGPSSHALALAAGTAASMSGKLADAQVHLREAQQFNLKDWKAPLFLAQVQLKLNEIDEAKKNLLLCVNLNPEATIAWGTLAEIALRENKLSLAAQHIAKAREQEPSAVLWRLIEARVLKRDNKPREAADLLLALEPVERLESGVLQTLAECYGLLQQPRDAALAYASSSDAQPARGDVALEAARWFNRASEPAAAAKYAQRAADAGEAGAADFLLSLDSTK